MDEWLTNARLELIAKAIFTKGVLKWGQYTNLKHHRTDKTAKDASPFYFDFRQSSSRLNWVIGSCLAGKVFANPWMRFTCIAGVPTGGALLAESLALQLLYSGYGLEFLLPIKKDDDGFVIPGGEGEGRKVILVDDVLTSGASALEAIRAFEEHGYSVEAVLFVVDRAQGGKKNISKAHPVPMYSLFTAPWLFTYWYQNEWIDEEQHDEAMEYIKNNQLTL